MNPTPAHDRVVVVIVIATCALALVALTALGVHPAVLPGVASVIGAVGLAVRRIDRE